MTSRRRRGRGTEGSIVRMGGSISNSLYFRWRNRYRTYPSARTQWRNYLTGAPTYFCPFYLPFRRYPLLYSIYPAPVRSFDSVPCAHDFYSGGHLLLYSQEYSPQLRVLDRGSERRNPTRCHIRPLIDRAQTSMEFGDTTGNSQMLARSESASHRTREVLPSPHLNLGLGSATVSIPTL